MSSVIRAGFVEILVIVPSVISVNLVVTWMDDNYLRMPWIVSVTIVFRSPTWETTMMSSWPMTRPISNLNIVLDSIVWTGSNPSILFVVVFTPNTCISQWMSLERTFIIAGMTRSSRSDISNLLVVSDSSSFTSSIMPRLPPTVRSWFIHGILLHQSWMI